MTTRRWRRWHQLRALGVHRARRFRHRLLLAAISAAFSVRQDQDRPLLRQGSDGTIRRRPRSSARWSASPPTTRHDHRPRKASRPSSSARPCTISAARRCRAFCSAPARPAERDPLACWRGGAGAGSGGQKRPPYGCVLAVIQLRGAPPEIAFLRIRDSSSTE